mmetsp:Transcript_25358/g.58395  ORF Transcript_25358/g.58395 Transcript_25358/m.58395 type:complete len:227 (-) Transcript_25358:15-695(-)
MLMVTTTVGMLDGVHRHTADLRPRLALHAELVVRATGLEHGLLRATTTTDDADHSAALAGDGLAGARGKLDTGLALIDDVRDDGAVVAGGLSDLATVTDLLLQVAHNGTLGHGLKGQHVANGQLRLLAAVKELSGIHALSSGEELLLHTVLVRVTEVDNGEGGTTTRIVDDVLDDALDVTSALSKVQRTELGGTLTAMGVGLEDAPGTLSLSSNHPTHCAEKCVGD